MTHFVFSISRYNCFLCDYDLCRDCVHAFVTENVMKIKENPSFGIEIEKPVQYMNKVEDKSENGNNIEEGSKEGYTLAEDDDIPLIDSHSSLEDIPTFVEKIKPRPKLLVKGQNLHFHPSVLDSPDIFNLRAPLVSCENILTPTISTEMLLSS